MAAADWIIVAILALSVFTAFRTGFFVASFSLAGVFLGLILASWNYQRLMPFVGGLVHSIPACEVISFFLIALGIMIVFGLVGRLLRSLFHMIGLGWADRLMGAAFGFLRGGILITVGVMALAAFLPHFSLLDESRLAHYFLNAAHETAVVTPADLAGRIRAGVKTLQDAQPDWLRPHA
ncbi:MAG TPA: CvpA family protein [Acidisarcina sp.]|nr:CvpA family protein [Acidisarcina sp.]